ncbi:rRNA-processing protein efg1-like [Zingiber officinale]|uniref:rRNA-processing protein efg1-like n=1 Tax=Zingiber officinale TaxID=94328 RepID=UPI001C4ADCB5|nr:rRNA-processing protein efg1-like [Zingiber officinale]
MAAGSSSRSKTEEKRAPGRRPKALGPKKNPKKSVSIKNPRKSVSIKNQIRSVERFLSKDLPNDVRQAQEEKLKGLQQLQDNHIRSELDHKIHLNDKRIRFFERRKIERMIKQLEKQCSSSDQASEEGTLDQLSKLREDLNYIRFFPKNERYVSLLVGGDNPKIVEKRNQLRAQIKANLVEATSNGEDLKETSENDASDVNEDDFFLDDCSSDEGDCDPADNNARESTSTAVKEKSVRFTDSRNQEVPARVLSLPPQPLPSRRNYNETAVASRSSKAFIRKNDASSKSLKLVNEVKGQHSNFSSSSEVYKPRRKRRPKKKKQA